MSALINFKEFSSEICKKREKKKKPITDFLVLKKFKDSQ